MGRQSVFVTRPGDRGAIPVVACPLDAGTFATIASETEWAIALRHFEICASMQMFPPGAFEEALELGCGDGKGSRKLEYWCTRLLATDCDIGKVAVNGTEKITFLALDAAGSYPYEAGSFELVFSSNLLEHLSNAEICLKECARVLKPGAYAVHLVPSRTWKVFNLLLFYPVVVRDVLSTKDILEGNNIPEVSQLDDNLRPTNRVRSCWQRVIPRTHGHSSSHLREFGEWSEKRWLAAFERSGLQVVQIVRLPFYYGYGFAFPWVLRLGNRLGLSSSTAFVLRKPRVLKSSAEMR